GAEAHVVAADRQRHHIGPGVQGVQLGRDSVLRLPEVVRHRPAAAGVDEGARPERAGDHRGVGVVRPDAAHRPLAPGAGRDPADRRVRITQRHVPVRSRALPAVDGGSEPGAVWLAAHVLAQTLRRAADLLGRRPVQGRGRRDRRGRRRADRAREERRQEQGRRGEGAHEGSAPGWTGRGGAHGRSLSCTTVQQAGFQPTGGFAGRRTTWPAYDSPAPNPMSSAIWPGSASPSRSIVSMASGIDAAEVLPVCSMSLEMATVSGSPRCLAIAELMRPLAWWGMNAWIWSAETPDASRVRSDALEICTAAHRNTREPFIVTYGCSVAPSAAWSMSSRQFLVCVIASACSPSEPHTTGPTSLPLSDGPTTTAPAPSPKMKAVLRSVMSRPSLIRSTPTTTAYRAPPPRMTLVATARP